jgi:hypothetical protein
VVGFPIRICCLAIVPEIDRTRQRGECSDVLVPPNGGNPGYRSLAQPHYHRGTILVLLPAPFTSAAPLARTSLARRWRRFEVVVINQVRRYTGSAIDERDDPAVLRCLELQRTYRLLLLGVGCAA